MTLALLLTPPLALAGAVVGIYAERWWVSRRNRRLRNRR